MLLMFNRSFEASNYLLYINVAKLIFYNFLVASKYAID